MPSYQAKRRRDNNEGISGDQAKRPRIDNGAPPEDEALTRVKAARLETAFDQEDDPRVTTHIISDAEDEWQEIWERDKFLGCGGFGTVYREVRRIPSGGTTTRPTVRAVKQLPKPLGETQLSGDLMRELHGLLFFKGPMVCDCPSLP